MDMRYLSEYELFEAKYIRNDWPYGYGDSLEEISVSNRTMIDKCMASVVDNISCSWLLDEYPVLWNYWTYMYDERIQMYENDTYFYQLSYDSFIKDSSNLIRLDNRLEDLKKSDIMRMLGLYRSTVINNNFGINKNLIKLNKVYGYWWCLYNNKLDEYHSLIKCDNYYYITSMLSDELFRREYFDKLSRFDRMVFSLFMRTKNNWYNVSVYKGWSPEWFSIK